MEKEHIYLYSCLYNDFDKQVVDKYKKSLIESIRSVEDVYILGESQLESNTKNNSENIITSLSLVIKSSKGLNEIEDIINTIVKNNADVFTYLFAVNEIKKLD